MQRPVEIPISDADWQRTPASVQTLVMMLWERVQHLERQLAELLQRRGRGGGSQPSDQASTSDKDDDEDGEEPSDDRSCRAATSSRKKRPSGRSPGAQPGHEGHGRRLLSVEQVDQQVPVKPPSCRHCGQVLAGDDPHPQRHQVTELPPVRPRVIEYQFHTLRCPRCDGLTEAQWPATVPRGAFGPTVAAWASLLSGVYRLSKRNTVNLLGDAFSLELAVGSVSQLEQRVSQALAAPVQEACQYVQQQPAAHLDETGWWERRLHAWLWTLVTPRVTVFAIRRQRNADVTQELLGTHTTAIVNSDRGQAYAYLPVAQRQTCWAHLERTFEKFVARGGEAQEVGQKLLHYTHQVFRWWHRVRDGTLGGASFRTYVSNLRGQVRFQLCYGERFGDPKTARTCANLRAIEPAMWTFARKQDLAVAPTNNAAEQALRHGVLWRKGSFGTHSPAGSRFVERMLTVRETLRQQQRNVLDYLTTACQASLHGQPAPSLLPQPDSTRA